MQNLKAFKDRETGKWGYKYSRKGDFVIPPKYDKAKTFVEGLARVCLNGKFGIIDENDKPFLSIKYDNVGHWYCRKELYEVQLNGKWGFVDCTEKVVIPFQFDEVAIFGFPRTDDEYDYLEKYFCGVKFGEKWGFIDKTGKAVTKFKYDCCVVWNDVPIVKMNGKCGTLNRDWQEVIPPKYDEIEPSDKIKVKLGDKWGFCKITGEEITPCKYDRIIRYYGGYALVEQNGVKYFLELSNAKETEIVEGKEIVDSNGWKWLYDWKKMILIL
jgi:hypothetical protein